MTWKQQVGGLIGCCIRKHRLLRGLSQDELGQLVDSDRPIVGRVERGVHVPSFDTIALYVAALGIPWCEIGDCIDAAGPPPGFR